VELVECVLFSERCLKIVTVSTSIQIVLLSAEFIVGAVCAKCLLSLLPALAPVSVEELGRCLLGFCSVIHNVCPLRCRHNDRNYTLLKIFLQQNATLSFSLYSIRV
jgi:hypothetical protein